MDNNQFTPEVETTVAVEEPRKNAIISMVLGILSIWFGWIPGIILAAIAKKMCTPILADFPGTASAKFANVARITAKIGMILSILTTIALAIYVVVLIFIFIAGIIASM